MPQSYYCKNQRRREMVATTTKAGQFVLNGIDYLEVESDYQTLTIHFVHNLPGQADTPVPAAPALTAANFAILGGVRIQNIGVQPPAPPVKNILTLVATTSGDFSTYTLRLQKSDIDPTPPDGFDPQLAEVDFLFKVECPSDFDCKTTTVCPPKSFTEPPIDYLAKDYASFRGLMLDRMAVTIPQWQERNPADLGITLVESLAYVADRLSYFQDAVATEAYLGTAHKRVSIRRHARLLDYFIHEGANARAWIVFDFQGTGPAQNRTLKAGLPILSQGPDPTEVRIDPADTTRLRTLASENPVFYETMQDLTLEAAHNEIPFYTWDDSQCCLPAGSTRATLLNDPALSLAPGSVLLFEEVLSPTTGTDFDADPAHRHAVRLTRAGAGTDKLHDVPVMEIEWDPADALPFPLCLSAKIIDVNGHEAEVPNVSIARGNVVLADHGQSIGNEPLDPPVSPSSGPYRPVLSQGPLTFRAPFDPAAPAADADSDPRQARPVISLAGDGLIWQPQYDLLSSDRFSPEFVVEMESDGIAHLRFGDGILGRLPSPEAAFTARYRVGNGRAGMVGAEVLTRAIWDAAGIAGLRLKIRNPLPAFGGADPEPLENIRQFAPQAFRTQRRAVTAADYAAAAQTNPKVQRAAATFRWTGSWYTVFVTIDRTGGLPVDPAFREEIRSYLEKFRLAGYDLEVNAPVFVPLQILISVCVKSGYFRADVEQALLQVFGSKNLRGGGRGFFHPDNFTFGQPVFLSQIYDVAQGVAGVDSIQVTVFQRFGKTSNGELKKGFLQPDALEIVRLDNDPNFPENGKIEFQMNGGL